MWASKKELSTRPPVLLLDGGVVSLSVARSLGRAGVKIGAFDIPENFARYSRYVKQISVTGDWLSWLKSSEAEPWHGSILFPVSDAVVELVATHRDDLEKLYILPEFADDVLLKMLDKSGTYQLAKACDTPFPKTIEFGSDTIPEDVLQNLKYPCALKPRFSHDFRGRQFSEKLFIVENQDELIDTFRTIQHAGAKEGFRAELLITEYIPGESEDAFHSFYTYLTPDGIPLFQLTKRKLRQYPAVSGNGSYHITNWNPEVAELGLAFLRRSGFVGFGAVEFKLDQRNGSYKLMECNARLTLATELFKKSGMDLSVFIYCRLAGMPLPEDIRYKSGVRLIRPLRDFLSYRDKARRNQLSFLSWFRSIAHRQHFDTFSWSDPLPWIMMVPYYLSRLLQIR